MRVKKDGREKVGERVLSSAWKGSVSLRVFPSAHDAAFRPIAPSSIQ